MHRVVVFKAMKLDEITEEMSVSREEFCELTLILECSEKKKTEQGKEKAPRGEGDGTPLQYSCLEKPMDGGAG